MDATELAKKMLEWQEAQAKADLLEMDIEAAVLELGKTQNVGNVRATYSAGRKSYDYESAFNDAWASETDELGRENFLHVKSCNAIVRTDYKAACDMLTITDIPFTQSAPSVTLKIVA